MEIILILQIQKIFTIQTIVWTVMMVYMVQRMIRVRYYQQRVCLMKTQVCTRVVCLGCCLWCTRYLCARAVATSDPISRPIVEIFVSDNALDAFQFSISGCFCISKNQLRIENIQTLVLHGAHVEVAHRNRIELGLTHSPYTSPHQRT